MNAPAPNVCLPLAAAVGLLATAAAMAAEGEPVPAAAEGIRTEAVRPNDGPAGRPLPLAASWNVKYWGPDYQVEMVRRGHHVLPWIGHPSPRAQSNPEFRARWLEFNGKALATWRAWRMPVTVRDHNYAMDLIREPLGNLPPEKNPCTIRPDGSVFRRPSPFGPVGPWKRVGRGLVDGPLMKEIQRLYPDPPMVMFLSNNETRLLRWHELGESKRYLDAHGKGREGTYKRKLVADGWIERFGALLGAMRGALVAEAWRKNAMFVGYNAFGPNCYGRWGGWKAYAIPTPDRIAPDPLFWDGGSPSYYDNNWEPHKADYRAWSCQTEAMNWVFMLREAHRLNPDFWFEISLWDGDRGGDDPKNSKPARYRRKGQQWTPRRYEGDIQYGLWLLRPRALREFRGSTQKRERYQGFWDAVLRSVDRVWADETLRRFWRKGRLVPNRARQHPWDAGLLKTYADADRWFHLDTSLDQPRPWKNSTEVRVWTLARVLGEKPDRQWLLYAHAPLGTEKGVQVTIPDGPNVTVDAPPAGSFYVVGEEGKARLVPDPLTR